MQNVRDQFTTNTNRLSLSMQGLTLYVRIRRLWTFIQVYFAVLRAKIILKLYVVQVQDARTNAGGIKLNLP